MSKHTALSSAKSQKQRGFLLRVFLKPMTIGLMVSFFAGVGTIGWMKAGQVTEQPSAPLQAATLQISIPQLQEPQTASVAGVQVFDYRGSGTGVSDSPRPLEQVVAVMDAPLPEPDATPEQDMAEQAMALQAVAPAAGAVAVAAAVVAPVRPAAHGRARIAIVIDDLGPNYRESLAAIALPKEITLAFLPYAEQLQTLTSRARASGHEMLVHMPMEPEDMAHNNPGPQPLTVNLTAEQISQRVTAALDSFEGHIGLNNHMGSRFTADATAMHAMMSVLAKRDQIFYDSRTTPRSVGLEIAASLGMRFAGRDVFLDNEQDVELITAQLGTLERLARAQGYASAIGHPYPETIAAIKAWLPGARDRGVELVPISALTQRLGVSQAATGAE